MQYEAKTPSEYLKELENDWRKVKLEEIRKLIKNKGPSLQEGIEYKMLSFGNGEKNIFHLNAQSAYVSLYVGNIDKVENAQDLLRAFDKGKGCIRIRKSIDLSKTGLEAFIKKTIDLWEKGGNTDC
ncbi:iron chaperone [Cyclobacterium amurskyense]|uniref:YdhG-like domain-containing protein n=1 Tax=Cyclobacterium amurskyense TaxID=320787 RepID=A0A0H4PPL6_9BACT|nr:DUF1801 domain-containing protein [Cyclobacterium amurskyense]AKP50207.1 hypothetical protein CA2015_0745 [Cyclobacterium amurskyense]